MQARLTAIVEEYQSTRRRLTALNAELMALTASARSADRSVTATVGPQGELVHLAVDPELGARLDLKSLSNRILEAAALATAAVREQLRERLVAGLPAPLRDVVGADGMVDVNRLLPSDPSDLLRRSTR
jgi:DNA-binding protein YbaB